MTEVFLWVPTRGWRLLKKFKSWECAVGFATTYLPLEVKVREGTGRGERGRIRWAGTMHIPCEGAPAAGPEALFDEEAVHEHHR